MHPLVKAIRESDLKRALGLLAEGALSEALPEDLQNAMLSCVAYNHVNSEEQGRPLKLKLDDTGPIMIALIDAGGRNPNPQFMVHAAAACCPEVVAALVDSGHPLNLGAKHGTTPLMSGVGSKKIVSSLLSAGADAGMLDVCGRNALHYVALTFSGPETIPLLLKQGLELDARDKFGRTTLMYAARTNCVDTLVELLSRGADPRLSDESGMSALDHAKEAGFQAPPVELRAWIAIGGERREVNKPGAKGKTPLMLRPLSVRTINTLIQLGADVDARDKDGMTPLMHQCSSTLVTEAVVQALLEAGAELDVRDASGRTAFDIAKRRAKPRVHRYLCRFAEQTTALCQ